VRSVARWLPSAFAALCLGAFVARAGAAPAPYYQWRSLSGGGQACAQTSPGEGWAQAGGPFVDAACTRPLRMVRL